MKLKLDDIVIWCLLLAIVVILLWLLHGSPTLESALISIGLFFVSSEILLWKKYFEIDKNTAVSFALMKNDLSHIRKKVDGIEDLLKRKR